MYYIILQYYYICYLHINLTTKVIISNRLTLEKYLDCKIKLKIRLCGYYCIFSGVTIEK